MSICYPCFRAISFDLHSKFATIVSAGVRSPTLSARTSLPIDS